MSKPSIVRKLMLPIEEYARVSETGTLQDALRALEDAQRHVRPDKQPHRAVLVERSRGVFVGLLGYKEILAALRPNSSRSSSTRPCDKLASATTWSRHLWPASISFRRICRVSVTEHAPSRFSELLLARTHDHRRRCTASRAVRRVRRVGCAINARDGQRRHRRCHPNVGPLR